MPKQKKSIKTSAKMAKNISNPNIRHKIINKLKKQKSINNPIKLHTILNH